MAADVVEIAFGHTSEELQPWMPTARPHRGPALIAVRDGAGGWDRWWAAAVDGGRDPKRWSREDPSRMTYAAAQAEALGLGGGGRGDYKTQGERTSQHKLRPAGCAVARHQHKGSARCTTSWSPQAGWRLLGLRIRKERNVNLADWCRTGRGKTHRHSSQRSLFSGSRGCSAAGHRTPQASRRVPQNP